MEIRKDMNRKKAFLLLLLFFAFSVLLRLPNLDRPLSRHHEDNSAVVLINLESWRQAGGGARFNFVPILNYQHPGDKRINNNPKADPHTDAAGNSIYLSFGPGWYILPYFFYQFFHLPVKVIYLQLINLCLEFTAVILLFFFCGQLIPAGLPNKYLTVLMACTLFLFSPGILWYLGNGYVTTGIMIPFLTGYLLLLFPMLRAAENIRIVRLILLALLTILLIYLDWFVLFLSATVSLYLLSRIGKEKRMILLLSTIVIASVAGICLLLIQFASYTGSEQVLRYWEQRFLSRSVANKSNSFGLRTVFIMQHMATAYLPLIILILSSFAGLRLKKIRPEFSPGEKHFILLFGCSLLLYHFVFLEWSSVHEFALLPLSLLLVYFGARLTGLLVGTRGFHMVMGVYFIFALSQYYYINRPGKISVDGMPYDSFEKLGKQLQRIPGDQHLYSDEHWTPVIDFYAKRTVFQAANMDSAKAYCQKQGEIKCCWIEKDNFQLKKIIPLR